MENQVACGTGNWPAACTAERIVPVPGSSAKRQQRALQHCTKCTPRHVRAQAEELHFCAAHLFLFHSVTSIISATSRLQTRAMTPLDFTGWYMTTKQHLNPQSCTTLIPLSLRLELGISHITPFSRVTIVYTVLPLWPIVVKA